MFNSGKLWMEVFAAFLCMFALLLAGCGQGAAALEPEPAQEPESAQEEEPRTVDDNQSEYIRVEIRGRLEHGVVAIGGETTGTTITAQDITWELDLRADEALEKMAEVLNGKQVLVRGPLEQHAGVEIPQRWIVSVESLEAAN